MLTPLKIVYGAVDERALLSSMSHIHVYDGRVQATNGRLTIDAPIPELAGMTFSAPADKFVAAVTAAGDEPKVVLDGPVVRVSGGRFRSKIPTLGAEWPRDNADPPSWELEEPLLPVMARVRPFMADDATNVWATCLLLMADVAVATNNVIIIGSRCTLLTGTGVEQVAVPGWTVDEMLRLKQEPTAFGIDNGSITFYLGDIWIKTRLVAAEWPAEKIASLLEMVKKNKKTPPVPEGLMSAVESVVPFCKTPKFPVVMLGPGGVSTEEHEYSAAVDGIALPEIACNAKLLTLVLKNASHLWLIDKDRLGFWCADDSRGILMGIRE
jgi:hypothetical protein